MRQLLTETMLLVATGGMLGLIGGTLAIQRFAGRLPLPRAHDVAVNLDVASVMCLLAVGVGLSAGWLPARIATRMSLSVPLNMQSRSATRSRQRVQRALLCIQTAAATMLIIGTGLLLTNVSRHTPPDAHVWVSVEPRDDGVEILVEDDGPGVPEDLRAAIFERFGDGGSRPKTGSPGGGVGLSLVARFAELHGGRAWVQDRDNGQPGNQPAREQTTATIFFLRRHGRRRGSG